MEVGAAVVDAAVDDGVGVALVPVPVLAVVETAGVSGEPLQAAATESAAASSIGRGTRSIGEAYGPPWWL